MKKRDKRNPFSPEQLRRIFDASIYTGCRDDASGYAVSGDQRPRRIRFWDGDAVHAMLPHHGQGANTTIEDAVTLAAALDGITAGNRDARFSDYQKRRALRTRMIQRSSWAANRALHTDPADPLPSRDRVMHHFPSRYGWIHDFDTQIPDRRRRCPSAAQR